MDTIPQGESTVTTGLLPSEKVQEVASDDIRNTLEGGLKHKNRILLGFFRGLEEYIVYPRYVDLILQHQLTQDSEFRQALGEKLTTILQSPAILSDDGWELQNFLIILATYEEIFKEVKLPATTAEVLRNRIEFLRANGQSDGIINRLAQFLPKH